MEDFQGSGSGGETWGRRALDSFTQRLIVFLLETSRQFIFSILTSTPKQLLQGINGAN